MPHFDVAVIGVGGIGSAALLELASRGVRVVGFDRFAPPHDCGSSHGHTRVIRQAYFEHPDYVPLLRATYDGWSKLEQAIGRRLLFPVGLLQVGPSDGEVIKGVHHAATQHNLPLEDLSPQQVAQRWPGLVVPDRFDVVFEKAAGYLLCDAAVESAIELARTHGASVVTGTSVEHWSAGKTDIELKLGDGSTVTCDRLLVTAGPWAGQALGELGIQLRVLRKSLFWHDAPAAARDWPIYLFELESGVFYGFPDVDDRGAKLGEHSGGQQVADPLTVDRAIAPTDAARIGEFRSNCLPTLGDCRDHAVCLYTMTTDAHFVVDHWPDDTRIAFAAGLSGHGFKFAPVLGRALTDLVLDGATGLPIEFLSLSRFEHA